MTDAEKLELLKEAALKSLKAYPEFYDGMRIPSKERWCYIAEAAIEPLEKALKKLGVDVSFLDGKAKE